MNDNRVMTVLIVAQAEPEMAVRGGNLAPFQKIGIGQMLHNQILFGGRLWQDNGRYRKVFSHNSLHLARRAAGNKNLTIVNSAYAKRLVSQMCQTRSRDGRPLLV